MLSDKPELDVPCYSPLASISSMTGQSCTRKFELRMRLSIDAYLDYTLAAPADPLFALEVAQMHDQILITDKLVVGGVEPLRPVTGDESLGRRTWA